MRANRTNGKNGQEHSDRCAWHVCGGRGGAAAEARGGGAARHGENRGGTRLQPRHRPERGRSETARAPHRGSRAFLHQ